MQIINFLVPLKKMLLHCTAHRTARDSVGEASLDHGPGNSADGSDHPQSLKHHCGYPREGSHVGLPTAGNPKSELTTTPYDDEKMTTCAHTFIAQGLYRYIPRKQKTTKNSFH